MMLLRGALIHPRHRLALLGCLCCALLVVPPIILSMASTRALFCPDLLSGNGRALMEEEIRHMAASTVRSARRRSTGHTLPFSPPAAPRLRPGIAPDDSPIRRAFEWLEILCDLDFRNGLGAPLLC